MLYYITNCRALQDFFINTSSKIGSPRLCPLKANQHTALFGIKAAKPLEGMYFDFRILEFFKDHALDLAAIDVYFGKLVAEGAK